MPGSKPWWHLVDDAPGRTEGRRRYSTALFAADAALRLVQFEVFTEDLLQLGPRVEETRHHRPLRDLQHAREILVAQSFDLPQQEDGAVLLRDLLQRLLD